MKWQVLLKRNNKKREKGNPEEEIVWEKGRREGGEGSEGKERKREEREKTKVEEEKGGIQKEGRRGKGEKRKLEWLTLFYIGSKDEIADTKYKQLVETLLLCKACCTCFVLF